jgi:hypothetical protein
MLIQPQEVHFMHERSTFLMWQSASQTVLSALLIISASPIAGAIGPGNWYILGAGLSAATFVLSIFFVPESRYTRSLAAYGQLEENEGDESDQARAAVSRPVKLSERLALDTVRYQPRTLKSDMRVFVGEFDWIEGWYGLIVSPAHKAKMQQRTRANSVKEHFPNSSLSKRTLGLLSQRPDNVSFPVLSSASHDLQSRSGVNIAIGTTYGNIITHAPYHWSDSSASYVNAGQIVVAFIALPLLGNGSDYVIKWRARRNGGVHEPENRLLLLGIPVLIGVIAAVLYGQAGQHPENYHWFVIVFANAGYYFAFVGANIAAVTYLLDSYPARAGPVLVVITAFRGFVSFGTSYGVAKFIDTAGYDGSFGTYGGLTALFGLLGIPIFLYGKNIRKFTGRWATKKRTGHPSMSR